MVKLSSCDAQSSKGEPPWSAFHLSKRGNYQTNHRTPHKADAGDALREPQSNATAGIKAALHDPVRRSRFRLRYEENDDVGQDNSRSRIGDRCHHCRVGICWKRICWKLICAVQHLRARGLGHRHLHVTILSHPATRPALTTETAGKAVIMRRAELKGRTAMVRPFV
jgi:hypothetical protein